MPKKDKPDKPEKPIKYPPGKKPFKYWKPPKAEKPERYRDTDSGVIIEIDRRNKHKRIFIEGPAPAPGQYMVFASPSMPFSELSKPIRDMDFKRLEKLEGN